MGPLPFRPIFWYNTSMPLDEDFLKKFKLKNLSPKEREAVERAIFCAEKREGKRINRSDTAALIRTYINRFNDLLHHRPTQERRDLALEKLKNLLHDALLSTVVPESYFAAIKRRHREEGYGDIEIPDDLKAELSQTLLDEQRRSLDAWIDYLASDDAKYPDALKYWTFRSILKMGRFDKEKHAFTSREGRGTISPFPELNREALAIVLGDVERRYAGKTDYAFTARYDIPEENKHAYRSALDKEDFSALYALAIDAFKPISEDLLVITDGEWKTFPRGSDHQLLVEKIQDYGTGWCIRGEPTARRYLADNTLHVYFSQKTRDKNAPAEVPRVVMVVDANNHITEVRGIEAHEHLDHHIGPVVDQKLREHPDGQKYQKKSKDMQCLTAIESKTKQHIPFTKEDLFFLYEVDSRIEGFGYEAAGRDPRIAELRSQRNLKEDLVILFSDEHGPCRPDQIATSPADIRPDTQAYIGSLSHKDAQGETIPIFRLLAHVPHVYASFPEGRICREELTIGTLTASELEEKLGETDAQRDRRFQVSSYARSMLHNQKQFIGPVDQRHRELHGKPETLALVRLTVADLGFPRGATTDEIFDRAQKLGLELCPPETGPHYRLQSTDQPMGDWFYIGMKQVADAGGNPLVFLLERRGSGLWLGGGWAHPGVRWNPDGRFVFRFRTSETQNL